MKNNYLIECTDFLTIQIELNKIIKTNKPVIKRSSLNLKLKASLRWCKAGSGDFGEWTFEGGPNNSRRRRNLPVTAEAYVCMQQVGFYQFGWHRGSSRKEPNLIRFMM